MMWRSRRKMNLDEPGTRNEILPGRDYVTDPKFIIYHESAPDLVEIDTSEVEKYSLVCFEGCALCCLCQAELVGAENEFFSNDPKLSLDVTDRTIFGLETGNSFLKLKDDRGSCSFLKHRICAIYKYRPIYCRLFPVHIYVGGRVQLVVNLSCRGLNENNEGISGKKLAEEALVFADHFGLGDAASEIDSVMKEFGKEHRVDALSRKRIQDISGTLLRRFGFKRFVELIMAYASSETLFSGQSEELANHLKEIPKMSLGKAALEGAKNVFSVKESVRLPVWTDNEMRWIVCRMSDGKITMNTMTERGELEQVGELEVKEVGLKDMTDKGEKRMNEYAVAIIRRDLTYDYASYLMESGGENDRGEKRILKNYLGTLGTILMDFWWWAGLLSSFRGKKKIDHISATDGIHAYDMHYLDLPSLGGFL